MTHKHTLNFRSPVWIFLCTRESFSQKTKRPIIQYSFKKDHDKLLHLKKILNYKDEKNMYYTNLWCKYPFT